MITAGLLFAFGTALRWVGLFGFLRLLIIGGQYLVDTTGSNRKKTLEGLFWSAIMVAVGLIGSSFFLGSEKSGFFFLPLVWFVMPFWAWLVVTSAYFVVVRLAQAVLASGNDWLTKLKAAALWLVSAVVGLVFYKADPANVITILKGGIPLTATVAGAIVALAVAGVIAMVTTSKAAIARGWAKVVVLQVTLVAGSIVFGLPFLWLVITSFKEDRDMSSPNGIVWVPRVQDTVQYMDHKDPLLQGVYKGITVEATIQERKPDGTYLVNVVRPQSIAGSSYDAPPSDFKEIPKDANVVTTDYKGQPVKAMVTDDLPDGSQKLKIMEPASLASVEFSALPAATEPVRHIGLKVANYPDALDFLPPETNKGLTFLQNTLIIVVLSVIGTMLSSALVAYAFSRMRFPAKDFLFGLMLSTMMLPSAVTMMPKFLVFRWLGWIDTLYPLWVPAFFGSAFNIFLLRQFLLNIPMELEDAAKIDGCTYLKTFWAVMLPQIKPALAVIGIWTFIAAWNDFMGPLIYVSSPEHMTISYALQMFNTDRGGEPGMLMAFTTLTMLPVLALFFFAQRYFIEGVTLSGLGGR